MRKNKAYEEELAGLLTDSSQEKEDQSDKKAGRSDEKRAILRLKLKRSLVYGREKEKRKYIAHLNNLINYCERMNGAAKESPEKIGKYLKASMILRSEIAILEDKTGK